MPRKSILTKPGVRKYGVKSNYTPETLEKIKLGALSRMEAAKEYKIPPVTLFYKLKEKHSKSVGRPVTLSKDEEDSFKSHLLILSDVGIPISMLCNISDDESIKESNVRITVEAEIHGIEKSTSTLEKNGPQRNEKTRIEDVIQEIEDDIEEDLSQEILNSANNYFENQEECAEELTFIQEYVVSSDGILLETHETSNSTEKEQLDGFANGMFCVFKEEGSLFPGCINKVAPEKITVSVLKKNYLGGWSWYSRNERCEIKKENVVSILKEHQISRKDGNIFIEDDILFMEWGE